MKKDKTCFVCGKAFKPFTTLQIVCSPVCSIKSVATKAAKKKLKVAKNKATRERLKTRTEHLKEAQIAFNAYIRKRDDGLPCISCGTLDSPIYDAGHYYTTAARPDLRFNENNCNRQCRKCNSFLSGNLILYRDGITKKIGKDAVESLDMRRNSKLTIDEIKAIRKKYKEKIKLL